MERTVNVSFPGGKRVDGEMDGRVVHTDQPPTAGGDGSAPTPFELFWISLATCAGYFALEFCQSRKIATGGLSVRLKCRKNEEEKRFDRVTIELTLPGGFPEKYEAAIVRAVDLCTVKRHVMTPPEFSIQVVK